MLSVWRRELQSYFVTAIGWVFLCVFLTLASVLFYLEILRQRSSDLLTFIGEMSYLWMLLTPVLTMRLLAEERQKRTDQLLLTSPLSVAGIVLGKYAAAVTVMLISVACGSAYVLLVAHAGRVWPGEVLVGALGFVLQGCAFIAMDLFISGLCRTPVTAAVASFGANFTLWLMDLLASSAPAWLSGALGFLSLYSRNEPFLMGQLSFASMLWDLSFAAAFLLLAMHSLAGRTRKGRS